MIKPILDKVAVKAAPKVSQTESGLYVPEAMDEDKPRKGEVVAVGSGKINDITGKIDPPQVTVGDTVVFSNKAGVEFDSEVGKILIMHEAEILAVIR